MSKQEFLAQLRAKLSGIPKDEIDERIIFYGEMIDDRIEDGLTEEQAIADLGKIEDIVKQTMAEIPLSKLVKEKVKPSRRLTAWEIVLLVLGSPIWLSLLVCAAAVLLSVYVILWSVIVSLWAVEISVIACSVGGVLSFVPLVIQGNTVSGFAMLGAGLVCGGLAIFGWLGCSYASGGIIKLTKGFAIWVKSLFIKKEAAK